MNLRNTPEISFVLDQSIEYGVRMTRLIDEVAEEDALAVEQRGEEEPEADGQDGEEEDGEK